MTPVHKHDWYDPDNEDLLRRAVAESKSIAGTIRLVGLVDRGGNYRTVKHHITRLSLDTSHHHGQGWNRGNYRDPNPQSRIDHWKVYLVRKHGHRCWRCGLTEWLDRPVPLELEHKDGDRLNNSEDNLELLCCNCHALTPTWRRQKRQ